MAEALLMRPLHGNPEAITTFREALNSPLPGSERAKAKAEVDALAAMGLTPDMVRQTMADRQRQRQNRADD